MISSSQKAIQEDVETEKNLNYERRMVRLQALFADIDADGSGTISEEEWNAMFQDEGMCNELRDCTALTTKDLQEFFSCVAIDTSLARRRTNTGTNQSGSSSPVPPGKAQTGKYINYQAFINYLKDESENADKRSVLTILARMQHLESIVERRFDDVWSALASPG